LQARVVWEPPEGHVIAATVERRELIRGFAKGTSWSLRAVRFEKGFARQEADTNAIVSPKPSR